jgi:drug/metabolite transporter (DMT)-like permease
MWILINILAAIAICFSVTISKQFGTTMLRGYVFYTLTIIAITGWLVPYGYIKAPSFISAYYVQSGALCVVGLLAGLLFFGDKITDLGYIGIVLISIGTYLISKN